MSRRVLAAFCLQLALASCQSNARTDGTPQPPRTRSDSLSGMQSVNAGVATKDTAVAAPTVAAQEGSGARERAASRVARAAAGPVAMPSSHGAFDIANEVESADELVVMAKSTADTRLSGATVGTPAFVGPQFRRSEQHPESARRRVGTDAGTQTAAESVTARAPLQARDRDGAVIGEFPLRHTDVSAEISGYLARTSVEQRYSNVFKEAIEAVYVFPLPSMAAVNDFVMEVGGRKIVGLVRPRAEAEEIYRQARSRGQTASLLTQERPNIFTQNVANIEPGGTVTIRITYFERLAYENGEYAYVFPMVVGPRYVSGAPQVASRNSVHPAGDRPPAPPTPGGGGLASPTDRVPDADRITPPVLAPGQRSGHDIALTVALDASLPITSLAAPTHRTEVEQPSAARRVIRLARADSIPNRDFVLRWKTAGAETRFGVLAHRTDTTGGYFTLTMQPPLDPADEQVTPREITFILDVSGSMMGFPIDVAKQLIGKTLDELRPDDLFNLVYFASGNAQLWDRARPRTVSNVAEAKRFLENLQAGGGTEMLAGLRRALAARHDPEYLQMYVFLTDGYIGEEDAILRVVRDERGDARFFGFGIGSSVNRYLIDGIGEHGGGVSHVVLPRDSQHVAVAAERLFDAIDSPVLVDIKIDWNGLAVEDVYPARLPDLFAGQTINVIGRYARSGNGTAYVNARVGSRRVRYPVTVELPEERRDHAALGAVWARHKIHDLSSQMLSVDGQHRAELEEEITDLAVRHRLVSQYTSFVAVDESRTVGDGRPLRILQPVELPEGVSYEGVFGERPVGKAMRIDGWGVSLQATEMGRVRVGGVARGGAAAQAGVTAGAALRAVNRTIVHDLSHLAALLLQSSAPTVSVEFDPGGEVMLPAP